MNRQRIIFVMLAAAVLGGGIWRAILYRKAAAAKGTAAAAYGAAVPVQTIPVGRGTVSARIPLIGDVKGENEVVVYPRVPGKLLKNLVREGDAVQRGRTLGLVDRDDPSQRYEPSKITAPVGAKVGRVYLDAGQQVDVKTPAYLLADLSRVRVRCWVDERDLPRIALGQEAKVRLDAYPNEVFTGSVTTVSPVVDRETRSAPIEVGVANPSGLILPGMMARVDLVTEKRPGVLVIPIDAIATSRGGSFVFVSNGGHARQAPVEVGIIDREKVEILSGLSEGDEIIVAGRAFLRDGATVQVIPQSGGDQ